MIPAETRSAGRRVVLCRGRAGGARRADGRRGGGQEGDLHPGEHDDQPGGKHVISGEAGKGGQGQAVP